MSRIEPLHEVPDFLRVRQRLEGQPVEADPSVAIERERISSPGAWLKKSTRRRLWPTAYRPALRSGGSVLQKLLPMGIALGLSTSGCDDPAQARIVRIANTRELERFWISESLRDEAERAGLLIESDPAPLSFDTDGNLPAIF
jgi:hypothetical protein